MTHPSISATIIQYGMPLDTRIRRSEFDIESSKNAREHVTVLQAACISPGEPQLVQFILQEIREDRDDAGTSLWNAPYLRRIRADEAFFESCHSGLLACAQVFLQFGLLELLNVESQHSVLGGAIGSKRAQLAVCLIDAGADVKQQWTQASEDSKADDVKSVMMHDTKGSSALMEAAFFGLTDVVGWCLERGAPIDMVNANNDNALTLAARGCVLMKASAPHVLLLSECKRSFSQHPRSAPSRKIEAKRKSN